MSIEEFEKLLRKLDSMQQSFGIGGVILILVLLIIGYLFWKILVKRTEKIVEDISNRNVKTFQSELDKGLVKFSSKHQKQIDAVQDCYQSFQELHSFINFVAKGEKFTEPMGANEEVDYLSKYRLEFKRSFKRNRILFPLNLNCKIEKLLPEIDIFIKDYIGGLLPQMSQDNIPEEYKNQVQIAGIWPMGKLEPTLEKMEVISKSIESEFRKIYGIED